MDIHGASLTQPTILWVSPQNAMVISVSFHDVEGRSGASHYSCALAVDVCSWNTLPEKSSFHIYFSIHRNSSVLLEFYRGWCFNTGVVMFLHLKLYDCIEKSEREPMCREPKPKKGLKYQTPFSPWYFIQWEIFAYLWDPHVIFSAVRYPTCLQNSCTLAAGFGSDVSNDRLILPIGFAID